MKSFGQDDTELSELGVRIESNRAGGCDVEAGKIEKTIVITRKEEDNCFGHGKTSLGTSSGSEENILPLHGTADMKSTGFNFNA